MGFARILVALDGSAPATAGGTLALALARGFGATVAACHACDVGIHAARFREMEPGLPDDYQGRETLQRLREAHGPLMGEGFESLAKGYIEGLLKEARALGVAAEGHVAEGRNYEVVLDIARTLRADLVVVGAFGLGCASNGRLGSTAQRVLRGVTADVLIARTGAVGGPVLVGIDGSAEALASLARGVAVARVLDCPLEVAAAYDPDLHKAVFGVMARSLSPERQAQVGLSKQEALHKTFIDDGLATLYQSFLDRAVDHAAALGVAAKASLLRGKACRALTAHAQNIGASLVVVGRFGHHRGTADTGSNAEGVAHLAPCSVLVTAPATQSAPCDTEETDAIVWDADALERLERIPSFARPMARQGIEQHVRARGGKRVALADVREVGRGLGMGSEGGARDA